MARKPGPHTRGNAHSVNANDYTDYR